MNNTIIRVVIEFDVPADHLIEVKRILELLIDRCKEEKGLLCYEWFFSDDETRLFAHEWYADGKALTDHMAFGGEELQQLLQLAPTKKIDVHGNLSDELREELKPFNATIVPYWKGFSRVG